MPASAPSPAVERRAVAALFFLNGFGFASWATRIPQVQTTLAIGDAALGMALLALAAGSLLSMPLVGALVARHGSARVTGMLSLAFGATLALPALAPTYPLLVAALAIFGACIGGLDVAMNAHAAVNETRVGRPIMASFHGLYSAGGLVGALVGGLCAGAGLEPGRHLLAIAMLAGVMAVAANRRLAVDPAREGPPGVVFARPTRELAALAVIAFCVLLGEGAVADWSAVYLTKVLDAEAGVAAAGFAAFSAAMTAGRFAGDRVIQRFGRASVVRWGGAVAGCGILLACLAPSPAPAIAGFTLAGAGLSCLFPCLVSAASGARSMPAGVAIAAIATMGYTGFLLGPPVIGVIAEWTSLRGGLALVALLCAVMFALGGRVRG
jgi:MFS family permease